MTSDIIPQFPPGYVPENQRTIDWGIGNVIAYASGCCVHLSYVDGDKLERVCSVEVAPYTVTCLALHKRERLMAVGDAKGRAFLWELDGRRFVASAKSQISNDKCEALAWKDNILIIMYESKHLCGYKINPKINDEYCRNFELLWDVVLPQSYTRFTIDPHFGSFMLFSGKSSVFTIYKINDAEKKPEAYFEAVELSTQDIIQDAQWSLHLPGYVFVVLVAEIMLFHMDSRSVVPIITRKTTSSVFSFLVQFQNDHKRLMTFHKNGAISVFEAENNFAYQCKHDFQPKHTKGVVVAAVNSNLRDDLIALYYSNTGLALLDLNSLLIKTANPIYPANITSFDCDGTIFVYGTNSGDIVFGNCFDVNELNRFNVGDTSVTYISFDATHRRIYWQTSEAVGVVDLVQKKVSIFQSRAASAMRCFGSHGGAFIVQRDTRALGVFIDDKEHPLLLKADMFDIAVDEYKSNQQHGRFAVLQKNQETRFYSYTSKGIVEEPYGLKPRNMESNAVAFGLLGPNFVTAFSNGSLLFFNSETKETKRVDTKFNTIKQLKFYGETLYGIGNNQNLFEIPEHRNSYRICQYPVFDYCLINDDIILVRMEDAVVRFLRLSDWKPVHYISKFLPLPKKEDIIKNFIACRKEDKGLEFLSEDARDVWQIYKGKGNLRLQAICGIGKPGYYEQLTCELLDKAGINTPEGHKVKFLTYIFANKLTEAALLLPLEDATRDDFMLNTAFGGLLLTASDKPSDALVVHLKTAATALMAAERFEDAAVLFRIAKLDRIAVDYFIEYGQIELAMRFVRAVLDGEEKETAIFRLGAEKYTKGKISEAIPFFAGSGQYHAVLAALMDLGHVVDSHFFLKELQKDGKLKPIDEKYVRLLPQLPSLDALVANIEAKYKGILITLQIEDQE